MYMNKIAFIGFGEVNTPTELIVKKCTAARASLEKEGLSLLSIFPVTDDEAGSDVQQTIDTLQTEDFDTLVLCIAGWIPAHAVVSVAEKFRHKPMVLWGLCGWMEEGRLVTTADQAGTSALRKTLADLGYCFKYVYDIIGKPSKSKDVADFAIASEAAARLRGAKVGMAGYRDMRLYGTLYDGVSLKRITGVEIETFEMLEMYQIYEQIEQSEKQKIVDYMLKNWHFIKEANPESLLIAAGYFLAVKQLIDTRGYGAVSLKDLDGMKKLLKFPPAPVFTLLCDILKVSAIPENDCLGNVTQLMVKYLTGQCGAYLEFYEFFDDRVLAGVPDFVPTEIVDGEVIVMPAAFGELSEGVLNVSKVRTGLLTMCRLVYTDGRYYMHMVTGQGVTPRKWEEAGWTQPAPQLPGLEILLDNTEAFTQNVMCQHYIITYGDNTKRICDLCKILGIEVI